ncbi:MAG: GNAT family N-acetyltransferase [Gammaproteobacteria bacterium]|nr:GNAT family N-acetyltransferase [Gammaproteobacteria bacterium]
MNAARGDYEFHYPELAAALFHALRDDAFYRRLESVSDAGAMRRYHDYSMREAQAYGELTIPEGRQYGVAIWARPLAAERQAEMSAAKKAFMLAHMNRASLEAYDAIGGWMLAQAEALVSPGAWYLSILGVVPAYQNRGLGASLVQPVLAQTDAFGVPTYLETFTPRNEAFYQRLGYRVAGRFHEPTTSAAYALMLRDPAG